MCLHTLATAKWAYSQPIFVDAMRSLLWQLHIRILLVRNARKVASTLLLSPDLLASGSSQNDPVQEQKLVASGAPVLAP